MESWELEARVAIADLVGRLAWAADRLDSEQLATLYADEGVLDNGPGHVVRGRAAIRAYFAVPTMTGSYGAGHVVTHVRHHLSDHVVELLDVGRAEGRAYFAVYTDRGVEQWGRYFDTYVVEDGQWRIASRKVRVDGNTPP
jgi:uncharacterized protein (TIGR02246 family)